MRYVASVLERSSTFKIGPPSPSLSKRITFDHGDFATPHTIDTTVAKRFQASVEASLKIEAEETSRGSETRRRCGLVKGRAMKGDSYRVGTGEGRG